MPSLSERIFDGRNARIELEDILEQAGVPFERSGYDDYDNSIELYEVDDDYRLSEDAQRIIHDAGFSIAFVNHKNRWETHYKFNKTEVFTAKEGWRVSYPHKRNPPEGAIGAIWVEKIVSTWPSEWYTNGKVEIKEK